MLSQLLVIIGLPELNMLDSDSNEISIIFKSYFNNLFPTTIHFIQKQSLSQVID
jgi:hypothetical protein